MTVTIEQLLELGPGRWRVTCSSDIAGSTFQLYLSGEAAGENQSGVFEFVTLPDEYPIVEVLDSEDEIPSSAWPSSVLIMWNSSRNITPTPAQETSHYLIEQFVGGQWTLVDRIEEEDEVGFHTWRTGVLADGQTHQFRVTPMGINGNSGTPRSYTIPMVRHPDPPSVTFEYDGPPGRSVTITAN